MNTIIQNILVFTALGIALFFFVKKFFLKKSKTGKGCGSDDECGGCH